MKGTERLLRQLNVQLSTSRDTPILGAGSYGRAFLLTNGQVLKVAVSAGLKKEYRIIKAIQENPRTQHFVIPVVVDSWQSFPVDDYEVAGYLLEYAGERIESSCPRLNCERWTQTPRKLERRLVKSLLSLHRFGLIHGDPRVDNVLLKGEELKWIDFMPSPLFEFAARVKDFTLLFHSLTGLAPIESRLATILDARIVDEKLLWDYLCELWVD
jgi:serine/threonine protein kinase